MFYGVKGHCYVTKIRAIVAAVRLGSTLSKWKWHTSGVHIGTSECVLLDQWFCSSHGHCPLLGGGGGGGGGVLPISCLIGY